MTFQLRDATAADIHDGVANINPIGVKVGERGSRAPVQAQLMNQVRDAICTKEANVGIKTVEIHCERRSECCT